MSKSYRHLANSDMSALIGKRLGRDDRVFALLQQLIQERTGLYYDAGSWELLADKLAPLVRAQGCESYLDYYYLLRYGPTGGTAWEQVIEALAVQETYFWREADQIQAVVNFIVPQLFADQPSRRLRIWSAACASGEEPLSIAMALAEAGWLRPGLIDLYASDLSPRAIRKAQAGFYRPRSFRQLLPELQGKYFYPREGGWQVIPELHRQIRWLRANLMRPEEVAPLARAQVIFCRNVFIYFAPDTIRRIAKLFYQQMPTPGYLCLGAAESLVQLDTGFELQEIGSSFVYVKQ